MLGVLSIVGVCLSFCAGFFFPKKVGWATLAIAPLLGATSFTFVPSNILPLTTFRVAAFITLGILLSKYNSSQSRFVIFKNRYFLLVCLFFSWVLFMEFTIRPENVIFTQLPKLFIAFFLPYLMINTKKDLKRFVSILALQAAVIGIVVIVEYYTHIKIGNILMSTSPGYIFDPSAINIRNGFYRPNGLLGNSVFTAAYLLFIFPFTILYAMHGKLFRIFPLLFACIGLLFLQTRMAFVAAIFLIISLLFVNMRFKGVLFHLHKKSLVFFIKTIVFGLLFILLFFPVSFRIVKYFIPNTLYSLHYPGLNKPIVTELESSILKGKEYVDVGLDSISGIPDAKTKFERLQIVFHFFKKKPFFGYGAPSRVFVDLMKTEDIPTVFMYLLSGGIVLTFLYILFLLFPVFNLWKFIRKQSIQLSDKRIAAFIILAFMINFVIVSVCWVEIHYVIMFMVYMAFYKVYYFGSKSRDLR